MIAGPVAVIPLACGRLELGLWPCGRLDTMVAGPVAVLSKMALNGDEISIVFFFFFTALSLDAFVKHSIGFKPKNVATAGLCEQPNSMLC